MDENRCFGLIDDDELMHAEYEITTIHYRYVILCMFLVHKSSFFI